MTRTQDAKRTPNYHGKTLCTSKKEEITPEEKDIEGQVYSLGYLFAECFDVYPLANEDKGIEMDFDKFDGLWIFRQSGFYRREHERLFGTRCELLEYTRDFILSVIREECEYRLDLPADEVQWAPVGSDFWYKVLGKLQF